MAKTGPTYGEPVPDLKKLSIRGTARLAIFPSRKARAPGCTMDTKR